MGPFRESYLFGKDPFANRAFFHGLCLIICNIPKVNVRHFAPMIDVFKRNSLKKKLTNVTAAQHMQLKLSSAGMQVGEQTNMRLWWQATPTGVLFVHHRAYIRARWHMCQRNHKTKNNYYVNFNTPTMQMLGVVFKFLRTKEVYIFSI